MNQLTQQLKSGEMTVQELPWPQVGPGMVLVRNHYSLISAGTEGSTVKTARKSLVGKAKERPQQVKQVIDVLKKQGPVQTYRAVMKKLDAYSPLGYSCAGEVVEVGAGAGGFGVGDRVACAGLTACHAEIVCVPANLCVKLAPDADLKGASYNTLGAISLQGIRQADLRLGESCAVIGLGLLGQLTCLMLRASGVITMGIDVDPAAVETAHTHCCDAAFKRNDPTVISSVERMTGGLGADAVIITAGTASLDPINFAGEIARKRGRVVVVGAVPTGFDRDPFYYRKELELRMSCSYGPGRYDLDYEEKGVEFPAAYVRWTENRNMQAFQAMIQSGRIDLAYLTTHAFSLEDAPKAYDMIVNRSEMFLGIVLKYDVEKTLVREQIEVAKHRGVGKVGIGFIGVGSYAQGNLLPNIPVDDNDVMCCGVLDANGAATKRVAERYGYQSCASDVSDIMSSDAINTVFIATRHDSHADYVLQALKAGKNVFVEKPLCLNLTELSQIQTVLGYKCNVPSEAEEKQESEGNHIPALMVGYNRRFAPLSQRLKARISNGPMAMIYRINAGAIPADTWIQDMDIGGGRILGEACHFVDYLSWMCGSLPTHVYASALPDPHGLNDTVAINLSFANGSTGTVNYYANGSKAMSKEYIEVYASGITGIIRDYKELEVFGSGKPERKKLLNQDKGQPAMVRQFLERIKAGGEPLIPANEIFAVTQVCFGVLESLRTRQVVSL
jgi:predicted dehydrogenase/threonine dehydrogenase-like Zn-dependent dehydrogenase